MCRISLDILVNNIQSIRSDRNSEFGPPQRGVDFTPSPSCRRIRDSQSFDDIVVQQADALVNAAGTSL